MKYEKQLKLLRVIPKMDDGKEVQNTTSDDGQLKNLKYFTMRILETSELLQFGDEGVGIIKHGAFFFQPQQSSWLYYL